MTARELLGHLEAALRAGRPIDNLWINGMRDAVEQYKIERLHSGVRGRDGLRPVAARKVAQVDTAGGLITIYHDAGTFYGFVGGDGSTGGAEGVKANTLEDVRRMLRAAWRDAAKTEWRRVLEVTMRARSESKKDYAVIGARSDGLPINAEGIQARCTTGVDVEVERYWLGRRFDGSFVQAPWSPEPPHPLQVLRVLHGTHPMGVVENEVPPCERRTRHRLEYDEDLWIRITAILEALKLLGERIQKVLSSAENIRAIRVEDGPLLLGQDTPVHDHSA